MQFLAIILLIVGLIYLKRLGADIAKQKKSDTYQKTYRETQEWLRQMNSSSAPTANPEMKPAFKPEPKPEPKSLARWKGQGGHPCWTDGEGRYYLYGSDDLCSKVSETKPVETPELREAAETGSRDKDSKVEPAPVAKPFDTVKPESVAEAAVLLQATVKEGICGENIRWELCADGTLVFTGSGPMERSEYMIEVGHNHWTANYDGYDITPWGDNPDTFVRHVIIDEGITSVGDHAFGSTGVVWRQGERELGYSNQFKALSKVDLPSTLERIEQCAFSNCTSLYSMSIPPNVRYIDGSAFYGTPFLKRLQAQKGFVILGKVLYSYGGNDAHVVIPEGITGIGFSAFKDCGSLISVEIPESVTSIDSMAFFGCSSLTSVVIPESVASIGFSAFANCSSLTSAKIPKAVTKIENCLFENCNSLTSVVIPEGVTSIGWNAFKNCSRLTTMVLPTSLTEVDRGAFDGCETCLPVWNDCRYAGAVLIRCEEDRDVLQIPTSFRCISSDFFKTRSVRNLIIHSLSQLPDGWRLKQEIHVTVQNPPLEFRCKSLETTRIGEQVYMLKLDNICHLYGRGNINAAELIVEEEFEYSDFGTYMEWVPKFGYNCRNIVVHEGVTISNTEVLKGIVALEYVEERNGSFTCHEKTDELTPEYKGEVVRQGYCGNRHEHEGGKNLQWELYDNNVLRIWGNGNMFSSPRREEDYGSFGESVDYYSSPWEAGAWTDSPIEEVWIEDGVTSIGDYAFGRNGSVSDGWAVSGNHFPNLRAVHIPASVTRIGSDAFVECAKLVIYAPWGSYAEEFAKEHQIPFEPKQEQEDAKPYWVTDGEGTYWVRGTGNIVSGGPSDSYINFFGEMFQDETCLMAPWAGGEDTVTEYISCHKVKNVHIGPDITELRWGAFGGCCDIESIHFESADTMIYDGIFGSEWSSCTKKFVNGEYKFTVHAPAGGAVEEFARKHNLEFVLEEKI